MFECFKSSQLNTPCRDVFCPLRRSTIRRSYARPCSKQLRAATDRPLSPVPLCLRKKGGKKRSIIIAFMLRARCWMLLFPLVSGVCLTQRNVRWILQEAAAAGTDGMCSLPLCLMNAQEDTAIIEGETIISLDIWVLFCTKVFCR